MTVVPHESDSLFAEIGRVTVRWAELEDVLGDFVASMIADDRKYTRVIATELSYQGLTNLLASLYIERHGEDDDLLELRRILARADSVEQLRNQVVHSIWISAGTPHKVTRVKSTAKRKKGYTTTVEHFDLDRFRQISNDIAAVRTELASFAMNLIGRGKAFNIPDGS